MVGEFHLSSNSWLTLTGSCHLQPQHGGSDLGYVDLPNLILEQDITRTLVLGNVNTLMLMNEAILGDGELGQVTIDVKGHSCDYNEKDIPYFAAAVKAIQASANLDLLKYVSSLDSLYMFDRIRS
jgi:hypothetical protein